MFYENSQNHERDNFIVLQVLSEFKIAVPLTGLISLTDVGQSPRIEPMNDHGAMRSPFASHCPFSLPSMPAMPEKGEFEACPWGMTTPSEGSRRQAGASSALPVPPRSRLFPFFLGTFFLFLFLLSGVLPGPHSAPARMASGSMAPLLPAIPNPSVSPSPGLPAAFAGTPEALSSGVLGLAASFIGTSSPDQDYSDLFCLHSDSGPGPVLECHHDDPLLTPPGISPSFLASAPMSPTALFLRIPNLTGSAKKVPSPTLSSPTPPPRGLLV